MAPTGDKSSSQNVLGMLGVTPETAGNPNGTNHPGNGQSVGPNPVLDQIITPKSEAPEQSSGPESTTNDSPVTPMLGLLTGTTPVPESARPDREGAAAPSTAADPSLRVLEAMYPGLPAETFKPPERASVSDFEAYNPNTVGLLPPTPQPARTLQGYDPSTDTRFELALPAEKPTATVGADDSRPATKARLEDVDGEPRYAVLNGANKYLYTVDGAGHQVTPGASNGSLDVSIGGGITQPTGNQAALSLLTVGTGTILARSAAQGAAVGTLAGPGGAALGATVNVLAALATIYAYEKFVNNPDDEKEPEPPARVDPGLLPDYVDPTKINTTPGIVDSGPAEVVPGDALGVDTSVAPRSPSITQPAYPSPAEDPNTVSNQILFPSAKPGQPDVPVEGTYWSGNLLMWAPGNPAGKKPGFAENPNTDSDLNLKAALYSLIKSGLDDIDEEHRPPIMAAMAAVLGTQLYRETFRTIIIGLAGPYNGDIGKLTGVNANARDQELGRLLNLGAPVGLLSNAIKDWWAARSPVDSAKELLGEAGAIAMLKTDGWTVNPRPKGSYTHDIVAVKDGQVMVIEAKGGDPGKPRAGEANVPAGLDSDTVIRAQQMTDPYLWAKLKEDAAADPEFKQWLMDQGVWTAIENEDPSKVGYRLIKTDTEGKIEVYGSDQLPVGEGIPSDTNIGQTTGNGAGPTLRGIAQQILQVGTIESGGSFSSGLFGEIGSWIGGLVPARQNDISTVAQLTIPMLSLPILLPEFFRSRKSVNESLTINVVRQVPSTESSSRAEHLSYLTYL